jgi:hypothetical protein
MKQASVAICFLAMSFTVTGQESPTTIAREACTIVKEAGANVLK